MSKVDQLAHHVRAEKVVVCVEQGVKGALTPRGHVLVDGWILSLCILRVSFVQSLPYVWPLIDVF